VKPHIGILGRAGTATVAAPGPTRARNPNEVAEELLQSYLSGSQAATWDKHGFFYVRGSRRNAFALYDGYSFWVVNYFGVPVREYHAGPQNHVLPRADKVLAQMLVLETNQTHLVQEACMWPVRHPPAALRYGEGFRKFKREHGPIWAVPPWPRGGRGMHA